MSVWKTISEPKMIRVLFVGVGGIAERHIANLKTIEPQVIIYALKTNFYGATMPSNVQVDRTFLDIGEALSARPDIAFITCPTALHIEYAQRFADGGIHLFIEKPLSNRIDGIDEFIHSVKSNNVVCMVGYVLRFMPSLKFFQAQLRNGIIGRIEYARAEVGQFLPAWRPGKDYRSTTSAQERLGGGAILELSHELDYVCWLFGKTTKLLAWTGTISNLELDVEDCAEIVMACEKCPIVSLHMDMIQKTPVRFCRVVGESGLLEWNGIENRVTLTDENHESRTIFTEPQWDRNSMYLDELRSFLSRFEERDYSLDSLHSARETLKIALAAKESANLGRQVSLEMLRS